MLQCNVKHFCKDANARLFWKSELREMVVKRYLTNVDDQDHTLSSSAVVLDWHQAAKQLSACLKHGNVL